MMLAALLRRGRLEQNCRTCRTSPEARERWGCDRPLERSAATDSVECPRCDAVPSRMGGCSRCRGEGRIPILRCPNVVLGSDPGFALFLDCYDLLQQGILPAPGGAFAQAHQFLEASRRMRSIEARLEREERE